VGLPLGVGRLIWYRWRTTLGVMGGFAFAGRAYRLGAAVIAGLVVVLALVAAAGAAAPSGAVLAFGLNDYGELGSTTNLGALNANPTPALVGLPGAVGTVTQLAAGYGHSLVLTSSGQLYAFGINNYGQLGSTTNNGTSNPNATPTLVTLPGAVGTVTRIAAGNGYSLVATSSGQLYAFGNNHDGQLGSATNNGKLNPNPTPTPVTLPGAVGTVAQVAAGTDHSLVMTSSGQLYAFGDNHDGQLGRTTNSGTYTANPTPTAVALPGAVGTVIQIAAGNRHSLVATSSGQLYAFGNNYSGELGSTTNNGNPLSVNPTPALVALPGAVGKVTQLTAGNGDSLVATSSGQLYAFGDNQYGQLGNSTNSGTSHQNPTPTLVALAGATIDTMAKGSEAEHALVLVSDLTITSSALPASRVNTLYRTALSGAGGGAALFWSASGLPGGLSLDAGSGVISGTPTSVGSFPVTITLTDGYGNQTSQTLTLTIAPAPAAQCPAGQSGTRPDCRTPVVLTRVSQTHRSWRERNAHKRKHGPPVGTTFSFLLNKPATVRLAFTQRLAGRQVNRRCVAPSRRNRRQRRCTRTVTTATLSLNAHAGRTHLAFNGRISRAKTLPLGSYALIMVARAGGQSTRPQTLRFTVAAS
jgi:alpha-tubulin suppressor-like RCC1 family protein